MADITTDITTLSQSFGTIIEKLKTYSGDGTNVTGKDAKALDGIISGLSTLQINLDTKIDGKSRLDNIKSLTNVETGLLSAFNSSIANITDVQKNVDDMAKFLTSIGNSFKKFKPETLNGVDVAGYIKPITGGIEAIINGFKDYIDGGSKVASLNGLLNETRDDIVGYKNDINEISVEDFGKLSPDEQLKYAPVINKTVTKKGLIGTLDDVKKFLNTSMGMVLTLLPSDANGGNNAHKINTKGIEIDAVFKSITSNVGKISDSISNAQTGAFKKLNDTLKQYQINDIEENTIIKKQNGQIITQSDFEALDADEQKTCTFETTKGSKGIVSDLNNAKTLMNKSMAMILTLLPDTGTNGANTAQKLLNGEENIKKVFKAITDNISTISNSIKNSDGVFNKLNSALSTLQLSDIETETLTYTDGTNVITAAKYEKLTPDEQAKYYGNTFKEGSKGLTSKIADVKSFLNKTMGMLISYIPNKTEDNDNTITPNNARKLLDNSENINKVIESIKTSLGNIASGLSEGGSISTFSKEISKLQLADITGADSSDIDYYTNDKGVRISSDEYNKLEFDKRVGFTPVFKKTGVTKKGLTSTMSDVKKFLDGTIKAIASIIPDENSNASAYAILKSGTKDIENVISNIKESLKSISTNVKELNTDMFDDIITNLKLGQTEETASYYEHGDTKHRLTRGEFDELLKTDAKKAQEYTFKTEKKDISMSESIRLVGSYITETIKSIEKVTSVPIWSLALAPIKMKIISSSIRKSVRSMIDTVMEINNMDETKEERLMKALGWVPENNKYLIAEDGTFVTREDIETDDDGKQTKKLVNVENANYKKGHFAAEDGLFKIGDYISTLIGCITKVAEINPIKMQIASLKVRFCIKGIVKTIGEMSRSIITEMSSIATDGTSEKIKKLMGSSEKRIEQVVEGNYSITDTTEKKEPGVFDTIITFFTIYDNVMKIADNGFIKTILRMQKAGINIRIMLHGLKSINKHIEDFGDSVAKIQSKDKKSDPIKTLSGTIDSLSKVVTSVTAMGAVSIVGLLMTIPLKLFLKAIVGGDNKNKNGENGLDNSIIGLLFRIKTKWESLEGDGKSKGKGGSFTMTILTMTGSFMLLIGAMVLVKQNVKSAFVGLISLTMLLASIIGILWVVSKLNKGGETKPENGTVGKSARTLLLISGALLGFALSLGILAVFVTKYNGELWRGILQISTLIAVSIGMLYLISLIKKPIDNGARQLLFIGGTFLLFTLVLGLITKIIQENESQMWNAILQLGLIVGIAVGTLFLLSLLKKDVTQGVIMMLLISGAFLIFGITMNLMFNAVKDASWGDFAMVAATLVLMIGAVMAIGAIMSVPLVGQIALGMILSGVGIMLAVSSGFLVFANTLIKINEVFENNSPQQVEKNLESMLVCLDKMTAKLSDMPDISRQQKKSMRRLASITDSIGSMANVLRDIADFRIANIDEKTGKIIGYRYITENDFARAGDNTKMIVQKMIELGKILADDDNGISRKDARKAKRQGKRLGRLASLTEPIQSTIELIETIAGGQITYMKNGKEVTKDITAFFSENGDNVKTSLQTFITGVNDIFSGINTSNGAYVNEYQSNMITTRMTAMSDMFDSMAAVADNGITKNLTTVSNSTEKMVNSINALNTDKVKQFRNVLEDLQDFNDELSDIFEKLEETMSTLVDEIKSVNGMESKSSGTKQTTSSSTTTVQSISSPNLTNIESDVDDLLNELRSIKALMQR